MSANKWVRSISFNKKNVDDVARLKLVGKKSFSKFIKKLMDEEIQRQSVEAVNQVNTDTPPPQKEVVPQRPKPSIYEVGEQKQAHQPQVAVRPQRQQVVRPQQPQPMVNPMLRR